MCLSDRWMNKSVSNYDIILKNTFDILALHKKIALRLESAEVSDKTFRKERTRNIWIYYMVHSQI